jgi:hypothetical protein
VNASDLVQAVIVVCSTSSCVLQTFTSFRLKRVAFSVSLCAQPFWFWTASRNGQWGIMALAFLFAAMATRGLWTHRKLKQTLATHPGGFEVVPVFSKRVLNKSTEPVISPTTE